jgi:excisionase family DNA binding protein
MNEPGPRRLQAAPSSPDLTTANAPVQLFGIADAAALLRVPEGWLRKKVTAGAVPHSRLGKHVRFTPDHLRRIVAAGEVEPLPTPATRERGLSPRARRARPVA